MSISVGWEDRRPGETHQSIWEDFWKLPQTPKEHYIYGPFANGLEVSIIRGQFTHGGTEGLWEIAVRDAATDVLRRGFFDDPHTQVLGFQTQEQVLEFLNRIANMSLEE